ncbi:hypothetical protein PV797_12680 [Clostridiaceae bacterium M8S5]|nr:hypothetical protein PV797_12680 [Clostridiaceae bacterium M8S5]
MNTIVELKELHNYEGDHFYLRGYFDCVRLLYRLNMIKYIIIINNFLESLG